MDYDVTAAAPKPPHKWWAYSITVLAVAGLGLLLTLAVGALWQTLPTLVSNSTPSPTPTVTPTSILTPTPTPLSAVEQQITSMSIRDKVTAMLILHTPGTNAVTLSNYVSAYHPGGLIIMGDNIPSSADQLKSLTAQVQSQSTLPLLLAVDEEGCVVKRLPWDTLPCAPDLGKLSPSDTQTAFTQRGQLLQQVGLNMAFGVVADVTADPNSFIYPRVFGGDPATVSNQVAAAVKGFQSSGVAATIKHFPGHGETEDNSHTTIPAVNVDLNRWQQQDKPPFMAGISAGAKTVMFGHLTYSQIDGQTASLSAKWHTILRDMGFSGVTVTDDMVMLQQSKLPQYQDPVKNAIAAINAGNDLILFVSDHQTGESNINVPALIDGLVAAVQNGQIDEATLDQALSRTIGLRMGL